MKIRIIYISLTLLATILLTSWSLYPPRQSISYNQDIRPIFNRSCLPCHGGIKQSGGFSLLFEEEAKDTTISGILAIIPGDAAGSELVRRLRHEDPELRMPLDHDPLPEKDIRLIERWIDEGAVWEQHWAYSNPNPGIKPPDLSTSWGRNEIDQFVWKRMNQQGLHPAAAENPSKLLRRLHLDLTGLPPTVSAWKNFLNHHDDETYEHLVDSLLGSPAFGEKWATFWLDLARYADSKGYEKDLYRSIWKYRDWVIRALNENMPYDQFTIEQLAGDLLPHPTQEQLIATAFHRNTMANDEGGTDNEEFRNYAVIERVGTTFEVWQGTTMACVQCHSHPYDPFRQEDFYEFMAYFNNTADRDIYHEGPNLFTYEQKQKDEVQKLMSWVLKNTGNNVDSLQGRFLYDQKENLLHQLGYRKLEAEYFDESSSFIELVSPRQDAIWQVQDSSWILFEQINLTDIQAVSYRYVTPYSGFIELRLNSPHGKMLNKWEKWKVSRTEIKQVSGIHDLYLVFRKNHHMTQDLFHLDWLFLHEKNPLYQSFNQNFYNRLVQLDTIPAVPTPILQELPFSESRSTHIFERGSWLNKGKTVQADIPDVLKYSDSILLTNRMDMAKWLVSPENPLTARVFVNRVWGQLFGKGLVATMEDFGTQGDKPSHPELLDWLAVEFMRNGWDIKYLIKQMVMSATYRQSSEISPEKLANDAGNIWLSRGPRMRMSAEQLRDQALAVSGLLRDKMYGPGVRPPMPDGVTENPFVGKWVVSNGEDRYRRAVYTYIHRTNPYPTQITFDASDRTTCLSQRTTTNTPLQALTLLNDPVFIEAASTLSKELYEQKDLNISQKLKQGYERIVVRPADDDKLILLRSLYEQAYMKYREDPNLVCEMFPAEEQPDIKLAAITLTVNAMLNLDETITK